MFFLHMSVRFGVPVWFRSAGRGRSDVALDRPFGQGEPRARALVLMISCGVAIDGDWRLKGVAMHVVI